jgi:hypothetical protein
MTNRDPIETERAAFQRLLEIYGANRSRWPAVERLRFASLAANDSIAREMLADTAALDAKLDHAPTVDADRHAALAARLQVLAAQNLAAQTPPTTGPPQPTVQPHSVARMVPRRTVQTAPVFRKAPALALLAASLAAGLFIGLSGALNTTLNATLGGFVDALGQETQLGNDLELVFASDGAPSEEDTL